MYVPPHIVPVLHTCTTWNHWITHAKSSTRTSLTEPQAELLFYCISFRVVRFVYLSWLSIDNILHCRWLFIVHDNKFVVFSNFVKTDRFAWIQAKSVSDTSNSLQLLNIFCNTAVDEALFLSNSFTTEQKTSKFSAQHQVPQPGSTGVGGWCVWIPPAISQRFSSH
jgi:hypothetical protein